MEIFGMNQIKNLFFQGQIQHTLTRFETTIRMVSVVRAIRICDQESHRTVGKGIGLGKARQRTR
jgi:hypothetical protein